MAFDIIRNFLRENALKFVAQEVLDDLLDKIVGEVCEGMKTLGLDPLPIPDIKVPYNLDKVTETVIPMIPDSHEPIRQALSLLRQLCAGCTSQVSGELKLLEGQLAGLAGLTRQGPVTLTWEEEGAVRLGAKFGVENLTAPFHSEASVHTYTINPDIKARLANVGLAMDVQVPVTSGQKVKSNFDMSMGPVDVDFDGLGPLGDLAEYAAPYISSIVAQKVRQVLDEQVKDILLREVEKRVPGISTLVRH